jgi:hypothetical protein
MGKRDIFKRGCGRERHAPVCQLEQFMKQRPEPRRVPDHTSRPQVLPGFQPIPSIILGTPPLMPPSRQRPFILI